MCYECRMGAAGPYLCPVDRKVWRQGTRCPQCNKDGIQMGTKWRAPKLSNEKAWRRVQAGDFLWETDPHPHYSGDTLNLAKKKAIGFGRYWPIGFLEKRPVSWENRIRDEILRRMNDISEVSRGGTSLE